MKTILFILCQYLVPQRLLSRCMGLVAECQIPWFKNRLIRWFIRRYQVDMRSAEHPDPCAYRHFNAFFTRALATDARPIVSDPKAIACPADGCISQLGPIRHGRIFQAKGQEYSLLELIGGDRTLAKRFDRGQFATIYLSPRDYHRVHLPIAGQLARMVHIPGDLFSVNDTTAQHVPRLFARNERVVCLFNTAVGPMAVILVGAMIVASIETSWAGLVTPVKKQIRTWFYPDKASDLVLAFDKGDEIGRFKLGSTAIILFGEECMRWDDVLAAATPVVMGQKIGEIRLNHPLETPDAG